MLGRKEVGLICLLLLLLSTGAHAKIVFSSVREGVYGVYIMDDDGSNQTVLTESETLRPFPRCCSPDGKQILFQRRTKINGNRGLFLMNADGTNIRQLTENDGSSLNGSSFSPDGKSIVFQRTTQINDKSQHSIVVLNIETGKMKRNIG